MKAGVAINPHTPVSSISDVLADIDLVCLMSVNPGFGGQKFIQHTIDKIKQLRKMIDDASASLSTELKVQIEIDGGVTLENAGSIIDAGADVLVAGNTVFKSNDPSATIEALKAKK